MPVLKNLKWEAFCQLVTSGFNETKAYAQVYEKDPERGAVRGMASRLRSNAIVAERIKELQEVAAEQAVFTKRDILLRLKQLVDFDARKLFKEDGMPKPISELDDDTAMAVQGLDVMEEFEDVDGMKVFVGYTKKYKLADRGQNIERAMRHLGLFQDKVKLEAGQSLTDLIMASKIPAEEGKKK
jgi:phage terminase small subunit